MSELRPAARLGLFAAGLAVAFAASFGVGAAFGDSARLGGGDAPAPHSGGSHGSHDSGEPTVQPEAR